MTPPIRMVSVPVEPTDAMMDAWHGSAWPQGPKVSPTSQAGLAFKRHYAAMLTASPVREEGGVVLAKRVSPGEAINRAVGDEVLTAKALESITTAGWVFAHKDDISTREVAPAEAGALVSQIDALLAIPEANLSSRIPYLARELLERSAKHLRAQPPARSGEG